jgi:lipopolysaccharide/colanic/teichoic acid biosynthesis glycosyltransferase
MKRLLDVVGAVAALLLLSPVLLAGRCRGGPGIGFPVLFRQQRVGLGGQTFEMLKFRSMVKDAARIGPTSPAATTRASRAWAASCAAAASTSCRSCSTCCAAT